MALQVADVRPHDRLLELGHGATLVRLDPGSAVLSDAEGSAALAPVDLAAARPDPFCRVEEHWLAHLEEAHPEVFVALARHLPAALRDCRSARVRPLGVDRCGLRLRVETPQRDHDVRLALPGRRDDARRAARAAEPAGRLPVPRRAGRSREGRAAQPEPSSARPSRTRRVTWRSATNDAIGIVPASRISSASSGLHRQRSASISVHTM